MYLSYYGLEFNPFEKEIDIKYTFETKDLQILNNRLEFIKEHKGTALITGEPGLGKTYSIRNFLSKLNGNLYKCIYLCMSTLTVMDFYRQLCLALGLEPFHRKIDMFNAIQERITSLVNDKRINIIIVIDEAQYLKTSILNDLKLLFNFEMDSKNYVSLILVGQPILNNILNRNIYEALKQRITVSYNLLGISKDELKEYITSRIKFAHGNNGIFDEQAIEAIYSACNGSIRVANNIITKCLIIGCNQAKSTITNDIVIEAFNDLELG